MFVYLIKTKNSQQYKIGIGKDVRKRIKELQTGNPEELILVYSYPTQYASKVETTLHNCYNYLNEKGEWFKFDIRIEIEFLEFCKRIEENITYLKNSGNIFI